MFGFVSSTEQSEIPELLRKLMIGKFVITFFAKVKQNFVPVSFIMTEVLSLKFN